MKFTKIITLVFFAFSANVFAGHYTDEMSKCLVKNTTQQDKEALIKWIYAAMSAHPSVTSLSNVSEKQGDVLNKSAAALMVELLTQRCKTETQQAIKNEGEIAIRTSFQILGQVAMQDLMSHQAVTKYIAGMANSVDKAKLEEVLIKNAPADDGAIKTTEAENAASAADKPKKESK